MAFFILHVISTRDIHIRPRDEVPRSNMGRGLTEQKYSYDSNIQCHRFRPEDRSTNPFQAILSYYDD
jgi:hypothetical protein